MHVVQFVSVKDGRLLLLTGGLAVEVAEQMISNALDVNST
jgi:hypothetical protein